MAVEVDLADILFTSYDDDFDPVDLFGWVKYVVFKAVRVAYFLRLTII